MSGGDAFETRMRRRAGSKSRVRVGFERHDESIWLDRDSSAAVRLRATPMGPPHRGQCQRGGLAAGVLGGGSGWRPSRASSFRASEGSGFGNGWRAARSGGCARSPLGSTWRKKRRRNSIARQRHDALLAAMGVILIAEGDAFPVEGQQAVIGNGDAMGVAAQIAEHMGGSAERWLGIDDPLLVLQSLHQSCKQLPVLEGGCGTAAVQQFVAVEALQCEEELVAKDAAEHRNGQQEARMGMDPALVVGGESAAGDDTVDMGMEQDVGTPAMEDGEEPDLGAEAFWIGCDLQ